LQGLRLPPVDEGMAEDIAAHLVLVACVDDRPCGFVVLSASPPEAHLINLAVSPDIKGGGLGRCLLEAATAAARARGATWINLATHREMTETIAFYRHLGWGQTGNEGDKVFMALQISGPDDHKEGDASC
jgi:GNAT superfamily N-acetyltransferase